MPMHSISPSPSFPGLSSLFVCARTHARRGFRITEAKLGQRRRSVPVKSRGAIRHRGLPKGLRTVQKKSHPHARAVKRTGGQVRSPLGSESASSQFVRCARRVCICVCGGINVERQARVICWELHSARASPAQHQVALT